MVDAMAMGLRRPRAHDSQSLPYHYLWAMTQRVAHNHANKRRSHTHGKDHVDGDLAIMQRHMV